MDTASCAFKLPFSLQSISHLRWRWRRVGMQSKTHKGAGQGEQSVGGVLMSSAAASDVAPRWGIGFMAALTHPIFSLSTKDFGEPNRRQASGGDSGSEVTALIYVLPLLTPPYPQPVFLPTHNSMLNYYKWHH